LLSAIILAAGQSKRMGRQKLLLPVGGKAMIAHIVDEILAGGAASIDQIIVVVSEKSADREPIVQSLAGRPVQFVDNPDPESEMLSSIRCGLRALPANCDGALVALGDQPTIDSELISQLTETCAAQSNAKIIAPTFNGKRGHPLIVPSRFFTEILNNDLGDGLRGFLDAHIDDTLRMPHSNPDVVQDIDHPADYENFLRHAKAHSDSQRS
jgi:molybdenum cofactor cytidylyltransferase